MRLNLFALLFSVCSLFGLSATFDHEDPITVLLKKLADFTRKYPQEKIYLHLDKPYYAVGDDIWFKAYVMNASTNHPSAISNILYVELIDDKDSLTQQLKLPMKSGISWGDFKLTDTLTEGNYRIRAYTQNMRNAGTSFFFDKTIKIGNSWSNEVFTKAVNQISEEENSQKLTSNIRFFSKDGKPYANQEVTYQIVLDKKVVSRGKGITNADGEFIATAINKQLNSYESGEIIATITMPDQEKMVKHIPIQSTSNTVDIQFFPEGGTLIEGLPCRIAFKAINAIGLGEQISGKVIDNEGTALLQFNSTNMGMGTLFLNPLPGKTYTAKVKLANGTEKTVPLPKAEKSGYQLSINNLDSTKINIKVMLTEDLMNKGDLKLVAQHNGLVYFTSTINSAKQVSALVAAKNEFASGIIQFTLFSAANIPVSERIIFVNNSTDKIDLNIDNLDATYLKNEKVSLNFNATNNAQPVQGSFSIAITNTTAVTRDINNESNIFTRLLLTSDLIGYVEKPNQYFLNNDLKTRIDLDNLLLTQGWRKINWKQIMDDQAPVFVFEPEKTMKISGKITKGGKPVANGKVMLFSTSAGYFAVDTLSDVNGNFNFDEISFTDSVKFIVQARTTKDKKNVNIDLDIIPRQIITKNKNTGDIEINVNESMLNYLTQSEKYFDEQNKRGLLNKTIRLKEVKVVGMKNQLVNSSNLNGPGRADAVITAKDLETAFSLSQYLSFRVPGVAVRGDKAYSTRGVQGGEMTIVLDGINLGGDFGLDEIIVSDIESVEVLRSPGNTAIYGFNGANGVIVITSKRGAGTEGNYERYTPGIVTFQPKGYTMNRQFYSPKYDVGPDKKPDLRTTVYWNPQVITDVNGKGNFNFYNTDQVGMYSVVIEGIDAEGNLARKTISYLVQ